VTGEHKNLKEPLTAFLDYLEQMNTLMNEEKERYLVLKLWQVEKIMWLLKTGWLDSKLFLS